MSQNQEKKLFSPTIKHKSQTETNIGTKYKNIQLINENTNHSESFHQQKGFTTFWIRFPFSKW